MSPIPFRWEGDSFTPLAGFGKRCDQEFVIGQVYHLEESHQRSAASHAQYFAALNEAFQNLPEKLAAQFASPEHLRKFALIRSGYRDERSIIAASKAEAQRFAAFIRPLDEYAFIVVNLAVVTVYTAKSQSIRAMGKADFEKSKAAVLDYVAGMVGVSPTDLSANAGRAA